MRDPEIDLKAIRAELEQKSAEELREMLLKNFRILVSEYPGLMLDSLGESLLDDDPDVPDDVTFETDSFGYTWLVVRREAGTPERPGDLAALCTELHAVNTTLVEQGFETGLLCTMVPFEDPGGQRFGLVYLYKQGTYYPFAPRPGEGRSRDSLLEIRVRDLVSGELPVEPDLQRWLALWGAPGL